MARKSREISSSGIYFVYFNSAFGIKLFYDNEDFNSFLNILGNCLKKYNCDLITYALNEKEAYILLKDNEKTNFSLFMRSLLSSYAVRYNRRYLRCGTVTSDRFKSVPVKSLSECIDAAVFIHSRAGNIFSGKHEYFEDRDGLLNKDLIFDEIGKENFLKIHSKKPLFTFVPKHTKRLNDEKILKIISKYTNGLSPTSISGLKKEERDKILRQLREKECLSIGTLQRVTGISRGIITRAYNKNNSEMKSEIKNIPDTTDYKVRNDVITQKITEKKQEEIWLL